MNLWVIIQCINNVYTSYATIALRSLIKLNISILLCKIHCYIIISPANEAGND